ncbi:MAG: hypothetical protein EA357_01920 [Micavibrio sp.]|nr:MAG: hypothetical protein EA357_01920 [Micavibrio sp.]
MTEKQEKTGTFRGFFCAAALGLVLCSAPAYADGMPPEYYSKEVTPLDRALMDLHGIGPDELGEPPVSLMPEAQEIEDVAAEPPKPEPEIAQEKPKPAPERRIVQAQPDSSFLGLSIGAYDAFTHNELAAAFGLEWQTGMRIVGVLQPIFGAMLATNGAMLAYGGVGIPVDVTERLYFMPSLAVGAYRDGGGYDLRRTLAYRFGGELGMRLQNGSRLSLDAHVLTNGKSLNRRDRTEFIGIKYSFPLSFGQR